MLLRYTLFSTTVDTGTGHSSESEYKHHEYHLYVECFIVNSWICIYNLWSQLAGGWSFFSGQEIQHSQYSHRFDHCGIWNPSPELVVNVFSSINHQSDIALGNIVGSNLFNVFLILGISATIYPVSVHESSNYDLLVNVGASLLLFVFVLTGRKWKVESWQGLIFVVLYVLYLLSLIYY